MIPFDAKIEGAGDKKNYAEYLYTNAGESILAWVIEGAKKVIELDYKIRFRHAYRKPLMNTAPRMTGLTLYRR